MAESINNIGGNNPGTPNFSPEVISQKLQSINEYIDTNLPLIMEGLNDADIEHEKKFKTISPFITKSGAPNMSELQTNVIGDSLIPPGLALRKDGAAGNLDYVKQLSQNLNTALANTPDPYKYARPTAFNASRFGHNYERYYASDDTFKKLGFNIYRDNETLYNQNNTWLDDFTRMGSKYMSLFGGAFTGMFKNWGKFGAIGSAEEAAKMENDLSIATSTKKGFGAWTTNFLANTAYTVGTITELALENFAIASAAAATRNPALIAVAGARNVTKLGQLSRSLSVMAKTLRDPSKARAFWTGAKGLGHNVLPMAEFRSFAGSALNPNSAYHRMSNLAKAGRGFGSFYRGMAEINAVTAESRLEGGFVQNKVAQDSYNAFVKEKGRVPNAEEANEIAMNAMEAGASTTLLNIPAIYVSNKIVFDTALKAFKPLNRVLNQNTITSPFYKIIENANWKKTGKNPFELIQKGSLFDQGKKLFSLSSLKEIPSKLRDRSTGGFKTAAGNTLRYFNANLMEGVQELYQEGLQEGVSSYYLEKYYSDLYQDPLRAANNTVLRAMSEGVMSQMSAQGLDVFLSGFLMGGVLQPVQTGIFKPAQMASMRIGDYINKTNQYEEYQKQEQERLQKYVDTLNDVTRNPKAYAKWIDENLKLQRDMHADYARAEKTGDIKEGEDAKQDSLFSHVYTLAATGKLHILEDQLSDLKNLTGEELAEAFDEEYSDTPDFNKNIQMRLDNVLKKVDQVKKRYDRASSIKNPFNPDYFSEEKDPIGYYKEKTGYEAFEKAKMMLAFNEYTFDRAMDRIESLVNTAASEGPLGSVAASDFSILYSSRQSKDQFIKTLTSEVQAFDDGTKEGKARAEKVRKHLAEFLEVDTVLSNYKALVYLIERAKTSPKALEQLEKMAADLKPQVNVVNEETGQLEMDFDQQGVAPDVIVHEYYKEMLKESYDKYVKTIAENNDKYVGQYDTNESLERLIDHARLDSDAKSASDFINILADPMSLMRMAERIRAAEERVQSRMTELHEKAVLDFTSKIQQDEFLQQLLEMGVYFKPEYVESFFKDDKLPEEFLDVLDGSTITKDDPKYAQIVELISKIEKLRGKTFSNKPAPERKAPEKEMKTPVTPAAAGATPGVSSEVPPAEEGKGELPEQDDEDPLAIYSDAVRSRLIAEFEKKYPDPATRPASIAEWIADSPIAAKIINGVGDKKIDINYEDVTEEITAENPKSLVTGNESTQPLYDNALTLNKEGTKYVGELNGEEVEADRVSFLVPKDIKADTRFSQARGNFIDKVLRAFSTPPPGGKLSTKDRLLNAVNEYNKTNDATAIDSVKSLIKDLVRSVSNSFSNDKKFPIIFSEGVIDDMVDTLEELAITLKDFTWHPAIPAIGGQIREKLHAGQIDLLLEKDRNF